MYTPDKVVEMGFQSHLSFTLRFETQIFISAFEKKNCYKNYITFIYFLSCGEMILCVYVSVLNTELEQDPFSLA